MVARWWGAPVRRATKRLARTLLRRIHASDTIYTMYISISSLAHIHIIESHAIFLHVLLATLVIRSLAVMPQDTIPPCNLRRWLNLKEKRADVFHRSGCWLKQRRAIFPHKSGDRCHRCTITSHGVWLRISLCRSEYRVEIA